MTYDSWNDLIFMYYFRNTSESKVIFHITLQDLIDFAKEENVEIAKNKFADELPDDFISVPVPLAQVVATSVFDFLTKNINL